MRKLVESTFITLDGVISDPEDWSPPFWNDEHGDYAMSLLEPADALVLGRHTYDKFASAWPQRSGDPYTDKMNSMPKYVASDSLTDVTWNAEVLSGAAVDKVAEIKQQPGGSLLKFGTGSFSQSLIEAGLIDELHLWMFPVVAGRGEHLLPGFADRRHFDLQDLTRFESGIVVLTYAPR